MFLHILKPKVRVSKYTIVAKEYYDLKLHVGVCTYMFVLKRMIFICSIPKTVIFVCLFSGEFSLY